MNDNSPGLLWSGILLALSALLISVFGGWINWSLTADAGGVIVRSPSSWGIYAAVHLFGGVPAALTTFVAAPRLRRSARHFRLMAAVLGNLIAVVGALLVSVIYGGTGFTMVLLLVVGLVGTGAFWLSLLPMKRTAPNIPRG
jgi:hypothetical protein